jgi:hypothetical protein
MLIDIQFQAHISNDGRHTYELVQDKTLSGLDERMATVWKNAFEQTVIDLYKAGAAPGQFYLLPEMTVRWPPSPIMQNGSERFALPFPTQALRDAALVKFNEFVATTQGGGQSGSGKHHKK